MLFQRLSQNLYVTVLNNNPWHYFFYFYKRKMTAVTQKIQIVIELICVCIYIFKLITQRIFFRRLKNCLEATHQENILEVYTEFSAMNTTRKQELTFLLVKCAGKMTTIMHAKDVWYKNSSLWSFWFLLVLSQWFRDKGY